MKGDASPVKSRQSLGEAAANWRAMKSPRGFGDDVINARAGNDFIRGGPGTNTLVLSGTRDDYTVTRDGWGNVWIEGPDGRDWIFDIQKVQFGDSGFWGFERGLA
jgi:hypothetical protein